jgi:hypothetical protein
VRDSENVKYKLYLSKAINEKQSKKSSSTFFAQYFGFVNYLQQFHLQQMHGNLNDCSFVRIAQMKNL